MFAALDQWLGRRTPGSILLLAACGVAVTGYFDFATGYEVSLGILYVGPVAMAAWYVGRRAGVGIAVICGITWYLAAIGTGNPFSHPAIPVWNASVRLGFFLISGLLTSIIRESLLEERRLARTDPLTNLFSRRALEERLEHDIALAHRLRRAVTIAYLDLDDFKTINDAHGHAEGDRVLRTVSAALVRALRRVDTPARLGGDEFTIVLPDTDGDGARRIMPLLIDQVEDALAATGPAVTCSVGAVTFVAPTVSAEQAVAEADALMYEVKRQGKAGVAYRVVESDAPDAAQARAN